MYHLIIYLLWLIDVFIAVEPAVLGAVALVVFMHVCLAVVTASSYAVHVTY